MDDLRSDFKNLLLLFKRKYDTLKMDRHTQYKILAQVMLLYYSPITAFQIARKFGAHELAREVLTINPSENGKYPIGTPDEYLMAAAKFNDATLAIFALKLGSTNQANALIEAIVSDSPDVIERIDESETIPGIIFTEILKDYSRRPDFLKTHPKVAKYLIKNYRI